MPQTNFIVLTTIYQSEFTGGWGGSWVLNPVAKEGDLLRIETKQTPNCIEEDTGVDLYYSNGYFARVSFEILGRYIACQAIKQTD